MQDVFGCEWDQVMSPAMMVPIMALMFSSCGECSGLRQRYVYSMTLGFETNVRYCKCVSGEIN